MRFSNTIETCRMDDETPMRLFHGGKRKFKLSKNCFNLKDGICWLDKRKCKIVTYVRVK